MNGVNPGLGRYLVPISIIAVFVYFLAQVHHILLPFVLAATLAYLLNPLVIFLEVRGARHRLAACVVFIGFIAFVAVSVFLAFVQARHEAARIATDWPHFVVRFQSLADLCRAMGDRIPFLAALAGKIMAGPALSERLAETTPSLALHAFPVMEITLLVPFLTLFFLLDGIAFRDMILEFVPARYVEMMLSLMVEVDNSLGNYIRGLFLQAMFLGLLAGVGFSAIGLHYAVQIALWVAATSMIPLIGAISAALAGLIVAFVQWGTVGGLVKVLIVSIGIRLLDDWLLHPIILRRAAHIHPAMTVFSLMAGGSLFGLWGLLFAVPLFCMIKVLLEVVWQWYRSEYGLQVIRAIPELTRVPLI